jgi:CHRD domain-containing protein
MRHYLSSVLFAGCFLGMFFCPAAKADLIFAASLSGTNEVPPNASPGTGFIQVDLHDDLVTLGVTESFSGLEAAATAAHIHCCAPIGTNAAVALPFTASEGFPVGATSGTFSHTFNLTTDLINGVTAAAFVAGLEGGNAYANIHDSIFPAGEIRGQLEPAPEPNLSVILGGCLLCLGLIRRKRKRA